MRQYRLTQYEPSEQVGKRKQFNFLHTRVKTCLLRSSSKMLYEVSGTFACTDRCILMYPIYFVTISYLKHGYIKQFAPSFAKGILEIEICARRGLKEQLTCQPTHILSDS